MNTQTNHTPSFVLGLVAIISTWFTFGISGIVCGIIGMVLASKNKREYNTTAAFVLSLIALIVGIIILAVVTCMLLVLVVMPDSIGAYYILDLIETITP